MTTRGIVNLTMKGIVKMTIYGIVKLTTLRYSQNDYENFVPGFSAKKAYINRMKKQ